MTEDVRQALRICPPGLRQAIDRLPDAGAMEELRLRCGQPAGSRVRSTRCRLLRSRRSCCAVCWSRQRSARPMPCRK